MSSSRGLQVLLIAGMTGAVLVAMVYTAVQPRLDEEETPQGVSHTLRAIHAKAQAHPMDYYHLNSERAAYLHAQLDSVRSDAKPATSRMKRRLHRAYARELLYAGKTRKAIRELTALLDSTSAKGAEASSPRVTSMTKPLLDLLAVAYLRLGEQQNCIDGHTAEACILPITGAGVHTEPAGSRTAITLYEKILRRLPRDREARWLLNIAYTTLGEYPEGVPAPWRIGGLADTAGTSVGHFRNVAPALGVAHRGLSGGTSVEDFNQDGFLDILATSYGLGDPMKLYLSDGAGGFTDRTAAAGLTGLTGGLNTVHADYDNDGDADVFVLRGAWLGAAGAHPNSLLENNGDGTFTDVTHRAGLAARHPTQTAAWGDFDRDGWVDLFVGNESGAQVDQLTGQSEGAATTRPSALYRNNGDGTFTDVAKQAGLDVTAYVKGAAWGDADGDGWPDLYISVMGAENRLFVNRGGASEGNERRFAERAAQAGVQGPRFSFPAWFWDYDNDGHDDLFVGSYDVRRLGSVARIAAAEFMGDAQASAVRRTEKPRVYHNDGDGTFTDVTTSLGLNTVLFAMGSNYGDLDNDGYQDFYVGTGAPPFTSLVPNRMFRNRDGEGFEDVSFGGGFAHLQKGHAVGFGDFDNDGDQDVYSVIGGAVEGDTFQNALFENPGHGNAWITLDLEGRSANRSAIGARLRLVVTDSSGAQRTIHRTVSTGGSFGASSLQQEIGLGAARRIDTLRVTWPNRQGTTDIHTDIAPSQRLKVVEAAGIEALPQKSVSLERKPESQHVSRAHER